MLYGIEKNSINIGQLDENLTLNKYVGKRLIVAVHNRVEVLNHRVLKIKRIIPSDYTTK